MKRHSDQQKLFDLGHQLPNGLVYYPNFISPEEEAILLMHIENEPLENATHTVHTTNEDLVINARRRHMGYGWGYNYRTGHLIPPKDIRNPLPRYLQPLARRIAKWLQISPRRVAEALVNEYTPGAAIGWHVDNENFEHIVGVSLHGWCKMKFRPLKGFGSVLRSVGWCKSEENIFRTPLTLEVEPRSAYIMQKEVRWNWQHSVAPVEALRYSITFRTLPSNAGGKR